MFTVGLTMLEPILMTKSVISNGRKMPIKHICMHTHTFSDDGVFGCLTFDDGTGTSVELCVT